MTYLWVAIGSAVGGLARYSLMRWTLGWGWGWGWRWSGNFPWSTLLINVLGAFVIGFFAGPTPLGGRFGVSENQRLFVMVGLCGGFTTFSSFSLQTFELLRSGVWGKALLNIFLSVVLCLFAVAAGHLIACQSFTRVGISQK